MYENRYGRFTAVDPLIASGKSANPQTFNRYIYVGNNPLALTDPLGLDWYSRTVDGNTSYRWSANNKTFGDGTSIEDWNMLTFAEPGYFYNGCANADCSEKRYAMLWKDGTWNWASESVTGSIYSFLTPKSEVGQSFGENVQIGIRSGTKSWLLGNVGSILNSGPGSSAAPVFNTIAPALENPSANNIQEASSFSMELLLSAGTMRATGGIAGSIGAMRAPSVVPGEFTFPVSSTTLVPVVADAPAAVHGNSLNSLRPTWGYRLFGEDGTFLKNGITSQPVAEMRYTRSFMTNKKIMTREFFPNRRLARMWEFEQNTLNPGPLNIRR